MRLNLLYSYHRDERESLVENPRHALSVLVAMPYRADREHEMSQTHITDTQECVRCAGCRQQPRHAKRLDVNEKNSVDLFDGIQGTLSTPDMRPSATDANGLR